MKKKDIITLIIAVVIFIIALALLYRYIVPPPKNSGVMVEVPHPVEPTFNQGQLNTLKKDTTDFTQDLTPKGSSNQPLIQ
ncbi:hypothetical protein HYX70_02450 [Candidatus Saccharibacteria bacterium]|nr:hypothetical protein [Candidatus Saccharibacteria bacterium]